MSNEIFGVDIQSIVLDVFGGNLLPLTLHKVTEGNPDELGTPTKSTADHAGEGIRDSWNAQLVVNKGWPKDTVRIIALQNGMPEPTSADEITIMAERWRIVDVDRDPVDATWLIAAVRS